MKKYSLILSMVVLLVGCNAPKLSWSFSPEARNRVCHARQVAVTFEYWMSPNQKDHNFMGPYASDKAYLDGLVQELAKRGYIATVFKYRDVQRKDIITIPAKIGSEIPERDIFPSKTVMARRYRAAKRANADLLLEFFVYSIVEEKKGPRWPLFLLGPWPECGAINFSFKLYQITLRISDPRNQTVLGTCRVEHPSALKDVLTGLDKVREGKNRGEAWTGLTSK